MAKIHVETEFKLDINLNLTLKEAIALKALVGNTCNYGGDKELITALEDIFTALEGVVTVNGVQLGMELGIPAIPIKPDKQTLTQLENEELNNLKQNLKLT